MLRDEINFQHNFFTLESCHFCHKVYHLPIECPLFHFVPDKDFLTKKLNYSSFQKRSTFIRKASKSKHALKYNEEIEKNVINLSTSLYLHYLDSIPENESQAEIEEINSPTSPGETHLMRKASLSSVSEKEELVFEEPKKEEKQKPADRFKLLYPTTKLLLKTNTKVISSLSDVGEFEVNL